MDRPPASRPTLKDRALADKRAREAREAAALRANLLRRKAQARSRAQSPDQPLEQSPDRSPSAEGEDQN